MALSRIFGTTITSPTQEEKTDQSTIVVDQQTKDLFKQAQDLYDEAIRSQKEGDWASYGEALKRLGEILRRK
ncbi:hypothetical protein A3B40_05005 [Candidatus Roizmanbacteria bacterium RIFCSPLOWO2_01_FULL_37_16]|uniref:Uncharacterized protein n=1 Tax=Candidatus Roizmanbacteria bacterium RIFCSPLOWO2_01_FULL_37_16 TaxID=1802058 RepID=A0A1F7IK30_9BACT|nr:MAG: hypothetical protein A3B40_05005 [Candidatus Roizmanbacteria bacterium RIFCSPLOWO2_01_FULL_37_16]